MTPMKSWVSSNLEPNQVTWTYVSRTWIAPTLPIGLIGHMDKSVK